LQRPPDHDDDEQVPPRTVRLPDWIYERARTEAKLQGMSFAEFNRVALIVLIEVSAARRGASYLDSGDELIDAARRVVQDQADDAQGT
jgi:hypothetical protein